MRSSPVVLVTDGEHRAALAVTRSLGRAGYRVVVTSPRARSIAGSSRFVWDRRQIPDPLARPEAFLHALEAAAAETHAAVLLPITDQSLDPVLAARTRFPGVAIPFPDVAVWRRAGDKAAVLAAAAGLGIAVPQQVVLERPGQSVPGDLPFPAVIKPARSYLSGTGGPLKVGVRYAADREALEQALAPLPPEAYPVLLQQRIVGPGLGVFLLMDQGSPLAAFGHRRILERPPSGGVSACAESVAVAPDLLEHSVALLRNLEWAGVAMVEYKRDAASGVPYLMEVNGRLWGSLQLAVDTGVDFPRLLVDRAIGRPVRAVCEWRIGVRCVWRLGALDHLLARVRHPTQPGGEPSLSLVLRSIFMAWSLGGREEVLRLSDPCPGFVELLAWAQASSR